MKYLIIIIPVIANALVCAAENPPTQKTQEIAAPKTALSLKEQAARKVIGMILKNNNLFQSLKNAHLDELPEDLPKYIVNFVINDLPYFKKAPLKYKITLLEYAIIKKDIDAVQYLLDLGAQVNKLLYHFNDPETQITPLYLAIEAENLKVLNMLIDAGADIDVNLEMHHLPLHFALWHEKYEAANLLLKRGAQQVKLPEDLVLKILDADEAQKHIDIIISYALDHGLLVCDMVFSDGEDLLDKVVAESLLNATKKIIKCGAPIQDNAIEYAWALMVDHNDPRFAFLFLEELNKQEILNLQAWMYDILVLRPNYDFINRLLELGAVVDKPFGHEFNQPDIQAIMTVIDNEIISDDTKEYIVELLIKYNAPTDLIWPDGDTLLHKAVELGLKHVVKALIKAGVPLNARNNEGKTPLDYAQNSIRSMLKKAGAKSGKEVKASLADAKFPKNHIHTRFANRFTRQLS